ncbi:glycoside hydrolase family 3 protein [Plicaturopsis crispa FD-325 SS-3]|nr:glycoside hydrolase family 3 protein [Plicaturopsis crispa FD-325 SS-3]
MRLQKVALSRAVALCVVVASIAGVSAHRDRSARHAQLGRDLSQLLVSSSVSSSASATSSSTSVSVSASNTISSSSSSSSISSSSTIVSSTQASTSQLTSTSASASASVSTSSSASASAPSATSTQTTPRIPSKPISGDGGWASAAAKAKSFVAGLSLEEKVNLTTGVDTGGRCVGETGRITRLNMDGFCLHDSPVGVRDAAFVSVFPAGINDATTWDAGLMRKRGEALGAEFRGKGVHVALGPMMNLARNAAGGRNWEGGGADPFLAGVHAAQNIEGMQSQGVIASAKHFALNEQEHYRGSGHGEAYSSNQDDRSFHELQLWPFAESVRAGVGSVMCAYNRVNQTYSCENRRLLNDVLKEELDFQGFALSDWAATESLYDAVFNGLDVNMPGFADYSNKDEPNPAESTGGYWGKHLVDAVRNGSIPESRLDDMVTRLMAAHYKLGQDKGFPPVNLKYPQANPYYSNGQLVNEPVDVQADHYKIIREIGSASTVLLKNLNNTLPLDFSKFKSIGIFGSDASGNQDGPNGCDARACDQGTLAVGWGSGAGQFPYLITPYEAISSYVHAHRPATVVQAVSNDWNYASVGNTADHMDVCLVFANADSGEQYLTDLNLWNGGDTLISTAASHCKNTVVVLHTVGPVLMESWYNNPNVTAILYAGLPGQESGNSILDILTGAVNPSARLPYTIAKQRSDYASDILYDDPNDPNYVPQIYYNEKLNIDYRHFDSANIEPRYEFGYGLSYTTFEYSGLQLHTLANPKSVAGGDVQPGGKTGLWTNSVNATFTVKNTGAYDGNEVAQLYIGFPTSANEPPRVLRGFERQFIRKGDSASVTIGLRVKDLSIWDTPSQSWVIPDGEYTVYVGSSSRKIHLQQTLSF